MGEDKSTIKVSRCVADAFAMMANYPDDICMANIIGSSGAPKVEVNLQSFMNFEKMESFLVSRGKKCDKTSGSHSEIDRVIDLIIKRKTENLNTIIIQSL